MHRFLRALLALLAAMVAFLVVGVAVTELLSSSIAFSLFVGIPAGLLAGVLVAGFTYGSLAYRDATGEEAERIRVRLLAFLAAVVTFGIVGTLATVAGGFGLSLLLASVVLGVPIGLFAAVAVALLVEDRLGDDGDGGSEGRPTRP
jgi:hypothetical protein